MLDAPAGWQGESDLVTDVLVVGTGFGGLAMAIRLAQAGFEDVLLIEKADEVGGTWRDNVYPGCACDVPSHLYSLSFAQNAEWSRMYPQQPELFDYVRRVVADYGVRPKIRFGTALLSAAWDEAAQGWRVETSRGRIFAHVLVSGMGGLHIPAFPKLPGIEDFGGKRFHSAQWDHGYDLAGKRVAVIGTGASAVQFVPQIAAKVARLDVYQRTAPWIIPKPDRAFGWAERRLLRWRAYRAAFRKYLFLSHEFRVFAFLGNKRAQALGTKLARRHMERQISDARLRAKLTPNYTLGCKRLMLSNDYYPALARSNVELVTEGIARVTDDAVVDAAGRERVVDAIIFGTGFEVTSAYKHWRLSGVGGQSLAGLWDRTGMRAFNGITVAGFPNFFMLLGPHTALGHNSVVLMIEAQVEYIVRLLKQLKATRVAAAEVREDAQDGFLAGLETRLRGTTWQDGGCDSWYKDEHGRVSTIWPGSAGAYQKALRHADLRDYRLLARAGVSVAV